MGFQSDATLTSKGQVTIPAGIRERLGVKAGDQLRFSLSASGDLTIVPIRRRSIFDRLGELRLPSVGRALTKVDIEESVAQSVTARYQRSLPKRRR
jgi:antitoxin PrlF